MIVSFIHFVERKKNYLQLNVISNMSKNVIVTTEYNKVKKKLIKIYFFVVLFMVVRCADVISYYLTPNHQLQPTGLCVMFKCISNKSFLNVDVERNN